MKLDEEEGGKDGRPERLKEIQERLERISGMERGGKTSGEGGDGEEVPELEMAPVKKYDIVKKICVIGDSGVGKKTILGRIAPFKKDWERYTDTIGTSVTKYTRSYSFVTMDIRLLIMVWDVTGKADYKHMKRSYYSGAEGIVVVADADDPESIENLTGWMRSAYEVTDRVPTMVLINKIDLVPEDDRKALDRKVREVLEGYEVPYFYTTKDAGLDTLKEPFYRLAGEIVERIKAQMAKKRYKRHRRKDAGGGEGQR